MSPMEFAGKYFGEFKMRGDEIVPVACPFCHGGKGRDKYTFALNTAKLTYNCKRGACGVSGTFNQLCREFGESGGNYEYRQPVVHFKTPKTKPSPAAEKVADYLKRRGFSPATWERRGIGEYNGAVAMPYYENGKLVLMKFRPAHKPGPGEKKAWREPGGKAVFWGMDLCDHKKPLLVTEGECDTLALDEAGIENVVSVPSGAGDLTCVDTCWDWLEKFKQVIIWSDNDEPGREMQHKLIQRLGAWRCSVVQHERKDANEVLLFDGKQAVVDAVASAKPVPMDGLIRLADVSGFDYNQVERVRSGIAGIDKIIGGFMMNELTVWTGTNSSGKSTLLGQTLLDAIEQGFVVCAYSGELPGRVFRYWIDLQAAGSLHSELRDDEIREKKVARVPPDITRKISDWYRDKFFLYDSFGAAEDKKILEVFEYAAKRYGCRVFMIDNLMTTTFSNDEKDFYRRQSNFIGKMKDFANKFDVHVHVVAHPRKTSGRLTKMDVSGSGDITNRADNVFSVHRCTKEEQQEHGCDAFVDIFKNRFSGQQDKSIALVFNETAKRFYMESENQLTDKYSWDRDRDEEHGDVWEMPDLDALDINYSEIPF